MSQTIGAERPRGKHQHLDTARTLGFWNPPNRVPLVDSEDGDDWRVFLEAMDAPFLDLVTGFEADAARKVWWYE